MLENIQIGLMGAMAGLITNILAVESLFHPYQKILGFQGFLMRNKESFVDRMKEMLEVQPREIEHFLQLYKEAIPFYFRFLLTKLNYNKLSQLSALFIQSKFTLTNKEFEAFCKSYAGKEILFIKTMGITMGFIVGIVVSFIN